MPGTHVKGGFLVLWVGWMGSVSLLVLAGGENRWLATGNQTSVMRNGVCSNQHIKLNFRLTQVMWVKAVFAFLGLFGADTFNIERCKHGLTK